jgi:hypothetical protein
MPFPSDFHPTPMFSDWISWCVSPENPDAPAPVPAFVREVCRTCRGKGTTWLGRPSSDAVSFTGGEWNEMHPDEQDEWMDGTYDQPCPECKGLRVVDEPTAEGTPPAVWAAWMAHCEQEWQDRAVEAQELRMGA